MKLGLSAGGFGPQIRIDIERIRTAEKLGYDSVWTAEAWGNDAITPLAWIAAQTEKSIEDGPPELAKAVPSWWKSLPS